MFSLQRFFGRPDRFFGLLEGLAAESVSCIESLGNLLANPGDSAHLEELKTHRARSKQIAEEISELVVTTFVTVLEREDLEALATALYKIPKPMEKFAERFVIAKPFIGDFSFDEQYQIALRAAHITLRMVQELRTSHSLERVRALNAELQKAESDADTLELSLLQRLYGDRQAALRVMIVKDLYDLLEKTVDRFRDAGNVVTHIVLKNS